MFYSYPQIPSQTNTNTNTDMQTYSHPQRIPLLIRPLHCTDSPRLRKYREILSGKSANVVKVTKHTHKVHRHTHSLSHENTQTLSLSLSNTHTHTHMLIDLK